MMQPSRIQNIKKEVPPRFLQAAAGCLSLIALTLMVLSCSAPPEPDRINIAQALSATEDVGCFEAAKAPADIRFPEDAGPHDAFRTEWWYYTGNLKTRDGRHFGYQLTFFRQALSCDAPEGDSRWRTRQLYFTHFAVTDTRAGQFYSDLRMNRQSLGIAGAKSRPFAVWTDNWRAEADGETQVLTADTEAVSIRLSLSDKKGVLLQGDKGFSRKGKEKTAASYYYSLPRLATQGTVRVGSEVFPVDGLTWFDHEWSTTALSRDVTGWDWFSVHLDDGRDLMVCQIRDADGTPTPFGFGSLSLADGSPVILSGKDFTITPQKRWKSPETGKTYPSRWQIEIPALDLALSVVPVIPNQEHTHMFAYWEGAARFAGKNANGLGYVELTGY